MIDQKNNYFDNHINRESIKKKTLQGAGASIIAEGLSFITNFLTTIILARLLTPNDFGMVGMVLIYSLLFQNFGMRGFTELTIQKDKIDHQFVSTIFWIHLGLSVFVSLVFMGLSPYIVWFYGEPKLSMICLIIPVTFILSALSTQPLALMSRKMEFYRVSACHIASNVTGSILCIVLAWMGFSYWSLVARRIAISLISALSAWCLCLWVPSLPRRIKDIKQDLKFFLNTYGNFVINYCSRNFDYLLIGWKHGSNHLGNYQKAYDLFVLPANQITYPLTNVFVASLSRLRSQPNEFQKFYIKIISVLAFVAMPISPILTLAGPDIMLILLGPQWVEAGHIFAAFGVSIGVMVIYGTHGWLHLSLGTAEKWFRWGIAEFLTTSVLFLIGLPFGSVGVAWGWSASYLILFFPGIWYAGKSIKLKMTAVMNAIWRYFSASFLSGLFVWFLLRHFEPVKKYFVEMEIIYRIITTGILGMVLYLLFIILLYASVKPIIESIKLLFELFPKNKFNKARI